MSVHRLTSIIATAVLLASAQIGYCEQSTWKLEDTESLHLINIKAAPATYKDRDCVRLSTEAETGNLAILKDFEFTNGTISLEVVGMPREGAPAVAKGFVGIAFRVLEPSSASYECFYIRPVNSKAESKVQRGHSVQ